jgi:hypothetical protein
VQKTTNLEVGVPAGSSTKIVSPGHVSLGRVDIKTTSDVVFEIRKDNDTYFKDLVSSSQLKTYTKGALGELTVVLHNRREEPIRVSLVFTWAIA